MRITSLVLGRKLAAAAILTGLLVLGAVSLWSLPVDFLPDITYPMIRVSILWPGATPEEIDRSIADPLERQMASVDDMDSMESSITEGNYRLILFFSYDSDVNIAFQDVSAAMGRVNRNMPRDIDPPTVAKMDPGQLPILQVAITSSTWDLTRLRTWTQDWLQKQLLSVRGVAGTDIVGGLKREIRIFIRPESLVKYGLTLQDVTRRIGAENVETFAGRVIEDRRHWAVRTVAEFRDVEELRNLILVHDGDAAIYLRDVADIEDGAEDLRVMSRLDGQPAIKLNITKQALANTVTVAREVMEKIESLRAAFPSDVRLVVLEDQAMYIDNAISGVTSAAIGAALLVIITIFLFLGSLRHVLVLLLAIPVILMVNFSVMKLAGFSLNIFSLGGLVVAMGVLLDNSIVVLENITRLKYLEPGNEGKRLIPKAVREVGPALAAGTLSFLALFVPFLFVPGLTSLMFRELILILSAIVVISVTVAITLTPLLADTLLNKLESGKSSVFQRVVETVTQKYATATGWVLRSRHVWLVVALLLIAAGAWTWGKLEGEFLPQIDDGRVVIRLRMQPGTSLKEMNDLSLEIEKILEKDNRVESTFTVTGGMNRGPFMVESSHEGEMNVQLKKMGSRYDTEKWLAGFRKKLQTIRWPGARVMAGKQRIRGIRRFGDFDMEVRILGEDLEELNQVSSRFLRELNERPDFTNAQLSLDFSKPEYQISIDRARCADMGLSAEDVAFAMRTYLGGTVATLYRERGLQFDVRVSVPEQLVTSAEDLLAFPLTRKDGAQILLSDVAAVIPGTGPVEINREDQVKQVVLRADKVGISLSEAQKRIDRMLEAIPRPPGITWRTSGPALMMAEMQRDMLVILLFALFFAGIVLTVQFNQVKLPLLILANLPVCLVGVIFSLYVMKFPVGATVIIGMLVVVAATVNDGVLLYTFAEDLRIGQGFSAKDAIVQAAAVRLRPRVMTTLSTLVGFFPLAINMGGGNEMLQPMAVGAIGGLMMETLVALFLMPVLYRMVYRTDRPGEGN